MECPSEEAGQSRGDAGRQDRTGLKEDLPRHTEEQLQRPWDGKDGGPDGETEHIQLRRKPSAPCTLSLFASVTMEPEESSGVIRGHQGSSGHFKTRQSWDFVPMAEGSHEQKKPSPCCRENGTKGPRVEERTYKWPP